MKDPSEYKSYSPNRVFEPGTSGAKLCPICGACFFGACTVCDTVEMKRAEWDGEPYETYEVCPCVSDDICGGGCYQRNAQFHVELVIRDSSGNFEMVMEDSEKRPLCAQCVKGIIEEFGIAYNLTRQEIDSLKQPLKLGDPKMDHLFYQWASSHIEEIS